MRNRLTHSLEVAQIGREFGAALGCDADVVDTACLAHDLGHPPFGHNGETALDEVAAGIGGFEGNAQTLRILTRLEAKRAHPDGRPAGLNLTRASLDAATKYPWRRGRAPHPTDEVRRLRRRPRRLRLVPRRRAPRAAGALEAQVMDWSDDVAYSVHDVEDAVASGWLDPRLLRERADVEAVLAVAGEVYEPGLTPDELAEALERLLATGAVPDSYDGSRAGLAALKDMTSRLIGRFVVAVEQATRASTAPGPLTRYGGRPRRAPRGPRRVRGAQGGGRPLRHARRRAGGAARAPARGGRRARRARFEADPEPARPRPAPRLGRRRRRRRRAARRSSTRSPRSPTCGR